MFKNVMKMKSMGLSREVIRDLVISSSGVVNKIIEDDMKNAIETLKESK